MKYTHDDRMSFILVIDYGEPSIHNIPSILHYLGVKTILISPEDPLPEVEIMGIVLSGGPDHIYENNSRQLPSWIDQVEVPVLTICYGMELMVSRFGGKIGPLKEKEKGLTRIQIIQNDPILGEIGIRRVWMNHSDGIIHMPSSLRILAISENGHISGVSHTSRKWWGVLFHPELDEHVYGVLILSRFAHICKSQI